jgi:hypothetical protein
MKKQASLDKSVISNIREDGRHVFGVSDPKGDDPLYFYSVGNSSTSNPPVEFICFYQSMFGAALLQCVANEMKCDSEFSDRVLSSDLSYHFDFLGGEGDDDVPLAIRKLSGFREQIVREKYATGLSNPAYSRYVRPHSIYQILVPDRDGNLPGDPKFSKSLIHTVPESLRITVSPQS